MKRWLLALLTLACAFWFPAAFTALLALLAALWVPLLPLAAGVLLDTLGYAPHAPFFVPLGTLLGGALTLLAFLVRARMSARMIAE